jgi:hypothetical protein
MKSHARFYKSLALCVLIGAAGSGFFALSLLAEAAWGDGGHVGNILMAGLGLLFLLTSLFLFVVVGSYWKSSKVSSMTVVPARRERLPYVTDAIERLG